MPAKKKAKKKPAPKKSAKKKATPKKPAKKKVVKKAVRKKASPKRTVKPQTPKHKEFCLEYIIDFNATRAYRKVYKCSAKVANASGPRLLVNVSIQKSITKLQKGLQKKTGVTAELVIAEYVKIAFATVKKGGMINTKNKLTALDSLGKHLGIYGKDNNQKGKSLAQLISEAVGNE